MIPSVNLYALDRRFSCILDRIVALERAVELLARLDLISLRLTSLEAGQISSCAVAGGKSCTSIRGQQHLLPSTKIPEAQPKPCLTPGASDIQNKLERILIDKGFSDFRFVRAPQDYYDQPLEFRMACVGAASTSHLCKSMIMENTRAHPSVDGWSNPLNSKFYVVIIQYTARQHTEKLKSFVHKLSEGQVGKQYYNFRLAPEDISDSLSGFRHNAVTPVGMATPLPIIMSHKIAMLQPDFFWLGGGEVDLKLGLSATEFIRAYAPFVVDCTYD